MDRNSMKRKASISHDEAIIGRLRKNRILPPSTSNRHCRMKMGPFCSLHGVISSKLGESRQNATESGYRFSFMESLG